MFRRVVSITSGCALIWVATSAAAQDALPSFRSPTCNAFCDLFTAFKKGLPSSLPAPQQADAPLPPPRPHVRLAPIRIYAVRGVGDFYDLRGRSVSLGLQGSDSETLGREVLAEAGVSVQEQPLDVDDAFDALSLGDIDALAVSGAKAYAVMDSIPAKYGVHRIQIPDRRMIAAHGQTLKQTALLSSRTQ
jgi:ABC-type amino acid transport substrate-binding protein